MCETNVRPTDRWGTNSDWVFLLGCYRYCTSLQKQDRSNGDCLIISRRRRVWKRVFYEANAASDIGFVFSYPKSVSQRVLVQSLVLPAWHRFVGDDSMS